jgi:hypothetical protein
MNKIPEIGIPLETFAFDKIHEIGFPLQGFLPRIKLIFENNFCVWPEKIFEKNPPSGSSPCKGLSIGTILLPLLDLGGQSLSEDSLTRLNPPENDNVEKD